MGGRVELIGIQLAEYETADLTSQTGSERKRERDKRERERERGERDREERERENLSPITFYDAQWK
jgi:hypothetical protein